MINTRLLIKINQVSDIQKIKRRAYRNEEPYLCPVCKRVWQPTTSYLYTQYVGGFPKFGCTKKSCNDCKKNNKKGEPK